MWRVIPLVVLVLSLAAMTHGQVPAADDWPMYGRTLRHTFDVHTGRRLWQFQVDCQHTIVPVPPGS
jgi:hypothetical protein